MFSKKFRNFLLFGCIAAMFAAVGYWNISPERFLDKPVVKVEDTAIDWYATNTHTLQYLPDGKVQYEMTSDKAEPGFFSKMFSGTKANVALKYQIAVRSAGEKSTISVLDANGNPETTAVAQKIVKVIADDIK